VQYQRKAEAVTARQWFPGKKVPGVEERPPTVRYSADRRFYYVSRGGQRAEAWLSVTPLAPPPVCPGEESDNLFSPVWFKVVPPRGEPYHRKMLPFAYWKVDGERAAPLPIAETEPLYLDYALAMGWPQPAPPHARAIPADAKPVACRAARKREGDGRVEVLPGDWLVTGPDGAREVVAPEDFAARFRPLA
jgi:hypothetical protein